MYQQYKFSGTDDLKAKKVGAACRCAYMYVFAYQDVGQYCCIMGDMHSYSVVSRSVLKSTEPFLRPKVPFIMTQNTPCTPLLMINVHQYGFTVEQCITYYCLYFTLFIIHNCTVSVVIV